MKTQVIIICFFPSKYVFALFHRSTRNSVSGPPPNPQPVEEIIEELAGGEKIVENEGIQESEVATSSNHWIFYKIWHMYLEFD